MRDSIFLIAGECAESVNASCTGKEEETWNDSVLTEEEQKQAELFAQQIDITNTNMILQYGAGTQ